ncbi:MAG: hypothetical protein J6K75_06360 [Erysipelotrichaceae bacterium]|nr:hypothetical protein [Erysipelotrichaceae bacterium]
METFDYNKGSDFAKEAKKSFHTKEPFVKTMQRRSTYHFIFLILIIVVMCIKGDMPETNNVPALFSLTEIGYETSYTQSTSLRNMGRKGWMYRIVLSNQQDETHEAYEQFVFELYDTDSEEAANDLIELLMKDLKILEQNRLYSKPNSTIVMNDGIKEPASQYYYPLSIRNDFTAYLLYHQFPEKTLPYNVIFMKQGNKVLSIETPLSFSMEQEHLIQFSTLMQETELFENARKENKNAG